MALKISIVTVCFNAVGTIEETMLSVLNQTYPNVEYIIIDGGSTDGTIDVIKKYADRLTYWISEPDKGIYDAMNKGIIVATGEYINFMNSGDKFVANNTISDIVAKIESDSIIVYGNWIEEFGTKIKFRKPLDEKYIRSKLPFCHQATFINTSYHKSNKYDTHFRLAGDYNFIYNAILKDNVKRQYISIPIAYFDSYNGASKDNYVSGLNEKMIIWGIKKLSFQNLYWNLAKLRMHFSYFLKKILPENFVITLKNILDEFRPHAK